MSKENDNVQLEKLHDDEKLLVITDEDNGYQYYVTVIDEFEFNNRNYVALIPYEPDDGSHREPEFVIMRSENKGEISNSVDTVDVTYESIRSKTELNNCFEYFLTRLEAGKCRAPIYAP